MGRIRMNEEPLDWGLGALGLELLGWAITGVMLAIILVMLIYALLKEKRMQKMLEETSYRCKLGGKCRKQKCNIFGINKRWFLCGYLQEMKQK